MSSPPILTLIPIPLRINLYNTTLLPLTLYSLLIHTSLPLYYYIPHIPSSHPPPSSTPPPSTCDISSLSSCRTSLQVLPLRLIRCPSSIDHSSNIQSGTSLHVATTSPRPTCHNHLLTISSSSHSTTVSYVCYTLPVRHHTHSSP